MSKEQKLERIQKKLDVLKDSKSSSLQRREAAELLSGDVQYDEEMQLVVERDNGVQLLVKMLKEGNDAEKKAAASALSALSSRNKKVTLAIVKCGGREPLEALFNDPRKAESGDDLFWGKSHARRALDEIKEAEKPPPKKPEAVVINFSSSAAPSSDFDAQLKAEVKALESGTNDEQCKAAEQLGSWAAASDEKRGAICKAGGCEALVALVVNGSEDAKCHAARALRNLANHAEAKKNILKADGIAVLNPLAKHGKGKVKEAASEAFNLLSLDAKAAADTPDAAGPSPSFPTGEGTRVAMFSARFDGGPMEMKFRKVFSILRDHKYDILMVAADAGESFGDLTAKYLERLRSEKGTMIAVCTKHYGEMTASSYSSHEELRFALDYKSSVAVLPLQVDDKYPPEPPSGPTHKFDQENLAKSYIAMVFKPSVVYLDCRNKSEIDIATEIAKHLQKRRVE